MYISIPQILVNEFLQKKNTLQVYSAREGDFNASNKSFFFSKSSSPEDHQMTEFSVILCNKLLDKSKKYYSRPAEGRPRPKSYVRGRCVYIEINFAEISLKKYCSL